MTATPLLVLPSPFLGPEPYRPLVAALASRGYAARVAPSPDRPVAGELLADWSDLAHELDRGEGVVLVAHSNAGYLAPAVAAATVDGCVVFVDAALPTTSRSTRLAPTAFRSHLAALAEDDGMLPRWTRWWPRHEMASTVPDPWFEPLDATVPRVPLAYVDTEVPVPVGWSDVLHAYLAFGTAYAEELSFAVRRGWPTRRLDGAGHLHLLLEAEATAGEVDGLLAAALAQRRVR